MFLILQDIGGYIYDARGCIHYTGGYVGQSPRYVGSLQFFGPSFGLCPRDQNIFRETWAQLSLCRSDLAPGYPADLVFLVFTDFLLEKLQRNHDLTRVRSIGGAAQVPITPKSISSAKLLINQFQFHSTPWCGGNPHPYTVSPH